MLKIMAGTFLLVLSAFYGVSVSAQDFEGDPKLGRAIYEQHCVRCHGPSGDGNGVEGEFLIVKPANFQSVQSSAKSNADLFTTIKYGVIFSPMHGWGDRLSDQDMADVIAYIRFLSPFKAYAQAK